MLPKYQISENGGLGVFPGSHLKGPQRDVGTSEGIHHCDQVSYLVPPPECLKSGQNFLCNNASSLKKVETLSVPQSHLSSSYFCSLLSFHRLAILPSIIAWHDGEGANISCLCFSDNFVHVWFFFPQTEWPMSEAMPVTAKAGDVLIFSYLLVHGVALIICLIICVLKIVRLRVYLKPSPRGCTSNTDQEASQIYPTRREGCF